MQEQQVVHELLELVVVKQVSVVVVVIVVHEVPVVDVRELGESRLVHTTAGMGRKDMVWWSLSTPVLVARAFLERRGTDATAGANISSNRWAA